MQKEGSSLHFGVWNLGEESILESKKKLNLFVLHVVSSDQTSIGVFHCNSFSKNIVSF